MIHYTTSNNFQVRKLDFYRFDASMIKSSREDFHDMFSAECIQREKAKDLSVVFCLTYNDLHLRTKYGQNLVDSDDLKVFAKSSAWHKWLVRNCGYSFDYVCVGEFGNGGKSHCGFSTRGVGNNPHFHCVGWFHKFGSFTDDYVKFKLASQIGLMGCSTPISLYDLLCMYVRYAWQNNLVDSIEDYSSDRLLQTCGLGFVELSGKIKYSVRAGSYISKYIGKDIKSLQMSRYVANFNAALFSTLCDSVKESFSTRFDDNYKNYKANIPAVISTYFHSPFGFNRYSSFTWYRPFCDFCRKQVVTFGRDFSQYLKFYDGWLSEIVNDFVAQYNEDMNGRYSPKLRKFRRFGYSLLDNCNKLDGTYSIVNKRGNVVTRYLPPSLARHLFYGFERFPNTSVTSKSKWIVRYYLNSTGRAHLTHCATHTFSKNFLVGRKLFGDEKRAESAAIIRTFLSTWNPTQELYKMYNLYDLTTNCEIALKYWLAAHQYIAVEPTPETRVFVDMLQQIKLYYPQAYSDYIALDRELFRMKSDKNARDTEYLDSWLRCYDAEDNHNSY